jgi:spore photoproduct lyase
MEVLSADRVLIARSAYGVPVLRERAERLLSRIEARTVEICSDEALEAALVDIGRRCELPRSGLERRRAPKRLVALGCLSSADVFPGYSWAELRRGGRELRRYGVMCQTAMEIQSAVGCPFDCTYCPYASFVCVRLDVEEFVRRVAGLTSARRHQLLFKLNNRTDTLGLEPEYGLAEALVRRFADLPNKYLMLYSKGTGIDGLLDAPHQGKTVVSFTLTPDAVARLLETGAPEPRARIAAIGALAGAGYPIRIRFSPIVPLRGWREAYRSLIEQIAAAAQPEMITMWTLSMIELRELDRIVPLSELDEELLASARTAEAAMRGQKGAPFPEGVRQEIYGTIAALVRVMLPRTAVSLCLETAGVWEGLASQLVPRQKTRFLCNCGPHATPPALVQLRRKP